MFPGAGELGAPGHDRPQPDLPAAALGRPGGLPDARRRGRRPGRVEPALVRPRGLQPPLLELPARAGVQAAALRRRPAHLRLAARRPRRAPALRSAPDPPRRDLPQPQPRRPGQHRRRVPLRLHGRQVSPLSLLFILAIHILYQYRD